MPAGDEAWLVAHPGVSDHSAALEDFADTAALIAHMDLVISIDTSVAHLAGALGVPVWIMLPASPDWRWLRDREDSPWYPSRGCSVRRGAVSGATWCGVSQRR
jgi:ADP-heptose:LPS heptosyltransferase